MTHPNTPRDIDLTEWLRSTGYHPADTELKQLGHEAVRALTGEFGTHLHYILPAGADKTHVFRVLRDLLMWANATLAVAGGPDPAKVTAGSLRALKEYRLGDAARPTDPRVMYLDDAQIRPETHAAQVAQLAYGGLPAPGDRPALTPEKPFTRFRYSTGEEPGPVRTLEVKYQEHWVSPQTSITVEEHHEAENRTARATIDVDDPDVLEEIAAGFLAAANRQRVG